MINSDRILSDDMKENTISISKWNIKTNVDCPATDLFTDFGCNL